MVDEHDTREPLKPDASMTSADPVAVEHAQKADTGHPMERTDQAADAAPADNRSRAGTGAADEGNLYDRLAAKDQEPTGAGGDGPVP